jgi:acyl-CoA synthetase (AMP-forming)/AMP-acid ligase II
MSISKAMEADINLIDWKTEFASLAAQHGSRIAVSDIDGSVTFAQLIGGSAACASHLRQAGVQPGEGVATLIVNSIEAVWVSLGILLAGACEVTLNPAQSLDEQEWCIDLVGPRLLIHDGRTTSLPRSKATVLRCDDIRQLEGEREALREKMAALPHVDGAAWSRILFTSGTTGRPKGAVHTHAGRWLANLLLRYSIRGRIKGGSMLLMTPFSHGSSLLAHALLLDGAPIHLVPGVDRNVIEPLIRGGAVRHIFAPPTVLMKLVEIFAGETIDTIQTVFTGTGPLSSELYGAARKIFGPNIRVTYGMSEIFNPVTVLEPSQSERWYGELGEGAVGMVGWPAPGVEISIRDDEGRDVEGDTSGQIFLRTRHMYAGYLQPSGDFEPAPAFYPTGDVGTFNPKTGLRLLGRMHDTIKTGGYKVMAQEVEVALRERGAAGEFVVLGLPSKYWGEVISCARAASNDCWIDEMKRLSGSLTRYKQPRIFVTVPTIWKNAIGKIDRKQIRNFIDTHYELEDGSHPVLRPRNGDHDPDPELHAISK